MNDFKYEPVLRYRKFQEESLQRELFEAKRRLVDEKQHLEKLEDELGRARLKMKQIQQGPLSSMILTLHSRFLDKLCFRIASQMEKIATAENECRQKQDKVLEALKKRKSLEKVKENYLEQKGLMQRKLQGKFLDEIAVNSFVRKKIKEDDKCKQ